MSAAPDSLLARARQGIEPIDLPEEIKRSALENFEDWLGTDKLAGLVPSSDYIAILHWMVEEEKFDLLIDSFYQMIPFGTGGRRGPVGVGPNRINPYTIASSGARSRRVPTPALRRDREAESRHRERRAGVP